jgi:hypothetical protein
MNMQGFAQSGAALHLTYERFKGTRGSKEMPSAALYIFTFPNKLKQATLKHFTHHDFH